MPKKADNSSCNLENLTEYPDFKQFSQLCNDKFAGEEHAQLRAKIARFRARYQLAIRFQAMTADKYSKATIDGYSAGLGVMLAHTALDHLCNAIGMKTYSVSIYAPASKLAQELREQLKNIELDSDEHFSQPQFREKFSQFMGTEGQTPSDDLSVAANAIRIMFAHGSYTVNATGANTKKSIKQFKTLRCLILLKSAEIFNHWLNNPILPTAPQKQQSAPRTKKQTIKPDGEQQRQCVCS